MHEFAITRTLVELIKKECLDKKIDVLSSVVVELGELTNYKKESLLFYYDLIIHRPDRDKHFSNKDFPNPVHNYFLPLKAPSRSATFSELHRITVLSQQHSPKAAQQ